MLSGYSVDDFSSFVTKLDDHIDLLDKEGTGNAVWRKVLGDQFPNSSDVSKSFAVASVQNCISAPHRKRAYWPEQRGGAVFISTTVVSPQGDKFEYQNNGESLAKHCSLHFKAITGIKNRIVFIGRSLIPATKHKEQEDFAAVLSNPMMVTMEELKLLCMRELI